MLLAQSKGKITYYGTSLGHLERSFVPYVFPPTNFALTLFAEGQKVPPPLFPLPGRTEGKAKVITVAAPSSTNPPSLAPSALITAHVVLFTFRVRGSRSAHRPRARPTHSHFQQLGLFASARTTE